jgi:flagellar basal body rod protein FlgB
MNTPEYQRKEIAFYAEMSAALTNYISLHVTDEEKADEIYQRTVDLVIKLTDK